MPPVARGPTSSDFLHGAEAVRVDCTSKLVPGSLLPGGMSGAHLLQPLRLDYITIDQRSPGALRLLPSAWSHLCIASERAEGGWDLKTDG